MHALPFDKPGRFWKGNLHTHSTISDGQQSPEAVCRLYREAGYDFLALTEHFMPQFNFEIADTRPFRTEDFTTIIGAELHAPQTEFGGLWHILAVGLPLDFAPPAGGEKNLSDSRESGPELAQRAMQAGAFVAIAHPYWYSLTEADALSLGDVHAVEIINGVSAEHNDRLESWHFLDVLSGRGRRYSALATDDYHAKPDHRDFARGWCHVKSEALEPESLLAALKAGHYYSSTGPQIHDVEVVAGECVRVRCSPVDSIFVTGLGAVARHQHGQGMLEAEFDIRRFDSPWLRVTVRDAHNERAWSNPIWVE